MRNWLIILILLTVSACTAQATISPTRISSGVTSIAMTIDPSPSDEPQITARPIAATQEIIDCPSAPAIRLIIQERGRVTDNSETLNLREGPGVSFDILTALDPNDEFVVIAGPSCDGEFSWFRVRFGTRFGWLAEGDFEDYYVEPYLTG